MPVAPGLASEIWDTTNPYASTFNCTPFFSWYRVKADDRRANRKL
jgi:hypothetical protein